MSFIIYISNSCSENITTVYQQVNRSFVLQSHNWTYSEIRRNKLPVHTTTWMDLNNSTLSEKSQTQNTYHMTLFTWSSRAGELLYKSEQCLPKMGEKGHWLWQCVRISCKGTWNIPLWWWKYSIHWIWDTDMRVYVCQGSCILLLVNCTSMNLESRDICKH